jgi:hypothetical protein
MVIVMAAQFIRAALRRRALSIFCAGSLGVCLASLFRVPLPLALVLWIAVGTLGLWTWYHLEPRLLTWRGCRPPNRLERERLTPLAAESLARVMVLDAAAPVLLHGQRMVVVSSALFDLLEDRALLGLLAQATQAVWSESLAGEFLVWLAILPLLVGRQLASWFEVLGRGLAVVIGWSLVLPLIFWPEPFVRWVGRLLGGLIATLVGLVLVANGLPGPGFALLVGWAAVPGLAALVDREWRRTEAAADAATVEAGLGWHLLQALDVLVWVDPVARPEGLLGLLFRAGDPVWRRAERLWRQVEGS